MREPDNLYDKIRFQLGKRFIQLLMLIGILLLFFGVQFIVKAFQKPGHMGIIESQAMDMTVQPPEGAMPVRIEQLEAGPFSSSVTYTGTVVAYNDIPIFPRVEGWIVDMPVYPGDRVNAGELLAQLDTRELSSRVTEARFGQTAAIQEYNATLKERDRSKAEATRSQQAIQTAKANLSYWQNEIRRAEALEKEEVITREEFEREQSEFAKAESEYNQAISEFNAAQRGLEAAYYQTESQKAEMQKAATDARTQKIIMNYTKIVAPKSGMIAERLVSPGTLVNPAMQIFRLVQLTPIRIQANVAESDLSRIHLGNRVRILDRKDINRTPVESSISSIFPAANLETRTSIVEAVVSNDDKRFIPGDYVTVDIITGEKQNVISVPNIAIVTIDQQRAVWLVKDEAAKLRYVTTGDTDGVRTEVIRGLQSGDRVVTEGHENLQDGVKVASAEYGPEGLKAIPKASKSNQLAEENHYRITKSLDHLVMTIELSTKPPKVGQNELLITLNSPHGKLPDNLSIEDASIIMPAMPSMLNPKPKVQKLEAGKFKVKLFFSMPGLWQVNFTLKEAERTVSKIQFEVKVPE